MPDYKQQQLDKLHRKLLDDDPVPELKTNATQLVFGEGSPSARIVFIGEAPGKNEDMQGLPFVGAAGKFLNQMLAMIDLDRQDVYITNIVKYRPPGNRDPHPEEKKAFLPYLLSQIEIIEPELLITLGRHSMEYFLPKLTISQCHGQPKRVKLSSNKTKELTGKPKTKTEKTENHLTAEHQLVILPLFHPAAALYNGAMKQTLVDDFAKIPTILKKLNERK